MFLHFLTTQMEKNKKEEARSTVNKNTKKQNERDKDLQWKGKGLARSMVAWARKARSTMEWAEWRDQRRGRLSGGIDGVWIKQQAWWHGGLSGRDQRRGGLNCEIGTVVGQVPTGSAWSERDESERVRYERV